MRFANLPLEQLCDHFAKARLGLASKLCWMRRRNPPETNLGSDTVSPAARSWIEVHAAQDGQSKMPRQSRMRWLRAAAIATLALLLFIPAVAGGAEPQAAASIAVEGNRRIETATVRSYFQDAASKNLDAAALDAGLKALLATGLFESADITHAGGNLVIHVVEAPLLGRVAFEGNKKIQDKELSAAIQSKPGGTLQRALVQADAERILEIYRRSGRDDVRIVPQTIRHGTDRLDLVFEIAEGAKTTVNEISFAGNQAFGPTQLKAAIKTRQSNVLSFLLHDDIYDKDQLEADRELLRRFYLRKGFADVQVASANVTYDPDKHGFAVRFTIDEGPVYRFGETRVVCNVPGLGSDGLQRLLLARKAQVFDNTALEKSIDALSHELARRGFPFAQVALHTDRDAATRTIAVSFALDNGPRAYVERIDIHGNTRTRDYVIRREFDIAEGDAYNKTLVDRAEQRLKNLNYFKTVKIEAKPGSAPDRVILNVDVEEGQTGDFSISGGYSTTDGALAEVKVGDHNFMGTGEDLRASVSYGQYARGLDLSATEPATLGSRIATGVDLFAKQSLASSYQSYGSESYGATLQVGTPITEQLGVQWRYSIYNQAVTLDPSTLAAVPSLPIQQAALAGPAWVSAVGDTVTYNTLDNNKAPTSGVRSQLSQDLAGLGGDVNFLRTTEDFRYYQSLNSDVVSIVRAQGGALTGWGGRQVPLIDTFFGGPQLVRGFAPNGFGPRDLTPGSTMDNVGGNFYWATSLELQSAIPGLPQEYGIKATAFVDAGSVWGYRGPTAFPGSTQTMQLANSNIVRSSVGAGLTWASPFGALTVDYAVPLTKAAYDVVQPLRFGAGPF
jgi:outer membrane protein insertion porin family